MADSFNRPIAPSTQTWQRLFTTVGAASVLASLALMAARMAGAISFDQPLQGMTRGVEYEMMYSIWRYVKDLPVYTDPDQIPFTASYYNWLHYVFYGAVAKLALGLLHLADAWLPTTTRLTTFAGCLVGTALTYATARELLDIRERLLRCVAALFSLFLFLGPLLGFWAIATGPDIWPMAFAAAAVWGFARFDGKHRAAAIILALVLGYAAWAFKHNFLYIPGTVGVYLLLRRAWGMLIAFSVLFVAAVMVTLWLGGTEYVGSLLFRGTATKFSSAVFVHNLVNFATKFLPVLLTLGACLLVLATTRDARRALVESTRARPARLLAYIGVGVSLLEAGPTSAIVNAAENHYFTPAVFLTLATLQLVVVLFRSDAHVRLIAIAGTLGWLLNMAAVGTVLAGRQGIVSVRPFHDALVQQTACLTGIAQPFYVFNSYLALPWLTPSREPFVVNFDYWNDIADGVAKARGGVRGLIEEGYFATVVLPQDRTGDPLAGVDLSHYSPQPAPCQGMSIYDRTPAGGG